jgi:hypothetical protein
MAPDEKDDEDEVDEDADVATRSATTTSPPTPLRSGPMPIATTTPSRSGPRRRIVDDVDVVIRSGPAEAAARAGSRRPIR